MTIKGKAENGQRVAVIFPDFVGMAGVQEAGDKAFLSYQPNRGGRSLRAGEIIQVAGVDRVILAAGRSTLVPSMVTLELDPR